MKEKIVKKKDVLLKLKRKLYVKKICLFLKVLLCGAVILAPLTKAFVDNLLNIAVQIDYNYAETLTSYIRVVYLIMGMVGLVLICWIYGKIEKNKFSHYTSYDAKYLKESLRSTNKNLPATDRDNLLEKVAGDKEIDTEYKQMIMGYIDQNVDPIKSFLASSDENDLIIQSQWGTGKTTSLLIAIDEFDEKNNDYRYIYESAFKYTNGLSEYFRDILNGICQILEVYGVKIETETKDLLENIGSDLPKTMLKVISMRNSVPTLSSGVIYEINKKVSRKNLALRIVVILDDLDRLDGDEIVKALSFLSMLRRLNFVKVILPLDSDAVIKQLDGRVYRPKQFMQKYLPEQISLQLKTNYEMVENVAIVIIKEKMQVGDGQMGLCYPIWEAVLISMISRRIRGELDRDRNYNFQWLTYRRIKQNENGLEWLYGATLIILNAPHYAVVHTEDKNIFFNRMGRGDYEWNSLDTNIRQFQHIIWALKRRGGRGNATYVRDDFTEEDYKKAVASWVRDYARDNWYLLGFSLRDVINTINGMEMVEIFESQGESFVNVFNQIFPQSPIKYSAPEDTVEK